jgi:hypothetical protein
MFGSVASASAAKAEPVSCSATLYTL